jgi:hypothetical protein
MVRASFHKRKVAVVDDHIFKICCMPLHLKVVARIRENPRFIPENDVVHHRLVLRTSSVLLGGGWTSMCLTNFFLS